MFKSCLAGLALALALGGAQAEVTARHAYVSFDTVAAAQKNARADELVYSIHLLMGKHAKPGNGAFSLTGQPSACGSAREVGTFCHRLPSDMLVANGEHRKKTESIWNLPAGTLNPKVGYSVMEIMRGLEDGSVNFMWTQVVNILQSTPNNTHWVRAARDPKNFVVVSDVYPTYSARAADLILPAAMQLTRSSVYSVRSGIS